jgi:hypothetical protein
MVVEIPKEKVTTDARPDVRKRWVQPVVTHLSAGAAENVPGSAIADSPLETLGS